ncbi:MAG: thrombospondin type 3 repeat-containing protein [Deltaproteobacteria bacterium]|nr:thrombospondin type 3 repeat-containing protein [Deltaproteobacteria bacterium]
MQKLMMTMATMATMAAAPVLAQAQGGECTGSSNDPACGAPEQSGGGGCGCGGGSILVAFTDQGDSYQYADDFDDDGFEDNSDNAPFDFNPDQLDTDGDGFGDVADFCVGVSAPIGPDGLRILRDTDADGLGDECDDDADGDSFLNGEDNCPNVINPFTLGAGQFDADNDGLGDACDNDDDADGCLDANDNCPLIAAGNCTDSGAVVSNECFPDVDGDQIEDLLDLCPAVPDLAQSDVDNDGVGDACDPDLDNDGVDNTIDNCRQVPNTNQLNDDRDSFGNDCDALLCFVVDGDEAGCLDPAAPFSVKAALANQRKLEIKTACESGEKDTCIDEVLLHIFANRENKAIRYTWVIVEQPADGNANVANPKGAVSFSNSIQYVYEDQRAATFTATVPGEYVVELQAELAFEDDEGYTVRADTSQLKISVGGETTGGCSAAPTSTPALFGLVGLVGLVLRRRRR